MNIQLAHAYRQYKKGTLTWEDYIYNMFRLVAGDPHEDDAWHECNEELSKVDLLGYSIFLWHKHLDFIKGMLPISAAIVTESKALFRHSVYGSCLLSIPK